ncbi:hypothetical protein E2562_029677 [Oryza meyeriana var. granulata]|uniref:Uncharacterized protein n=1 Tax=Oryza meyeriana var. granulata TaxID=110450 RepID=A0A6G1C2I4_9ORYZ|nr:hypothetical protein E2562_029677 [Oryza meyeriana var. granulata]
MREVDPHPHWAPKEVRRRRVRYPTGHRESVRRQFCCPETVEVGNARALHRSRVSPILFFSCMSHHTLPLPAKMGRL